MMLFFVFCSYGNKVETSVKSEVKEKEELKNLLK